MPSWFIAAESEELASECRMDGFDVTIEVTRNPLAAARTALCDFAAVALATSEWPDAASLSDLADAKKPDVRLALAVVGPLNGPRRSFCHDLGIVAVDEVEALRAIIAIVHSAVRDPWTADQRSLPPVDRKRLAVFPEGRGQNGVRLVRLPSGLLGMETTQPASLTPLGAARDVAAALLAMRCSEASIPAPKVTDDRVDAQAVLDVIFGPARALSDPASKSALVPYGVPLPVEELCASPSRAASEAARIGFPVRIALASPDLRIWDHPDLEVEAVDNAAQCRDAFRQLMALAERRAPAARLLGVTVSATTPAVATLRVTLTPLPGGRVLLELGFADAHGIASDDRTESVLPMRRQDLEMVLGRLRGRELLLGGPAGERALVVQSIQDVLAQLSRFVTRFHREVECVTIDPLALLVSGAVELREACVVVTDAFERSLEMAGRSG